MRYIASLLTAVMLTVVSARAETAPDSIAGIDTRPTVDDVIAPMAIIAAGSVAASVPWWRVHVDREADRIMGSSRKWRIADAAEWLPYAFVIGGEYAGAPARAGIVDRTLLTATSFVILEVVTQPVKRLAGRRRPDLSDNHSFPSGHTATAFAGAELTRMIYGNAWGAASYAVATGVAAMRMAGRHHFLSDCIAGAGIGILSARAAAWLLPLERRLLRLGESPSAPSRHTDMALLPIASPEGIGAAAIITF